MEPAAEKQSTLVPGQPKGWKRRGNPKMAVTFSEMVKAWPYCTFLIVLNEFCQRFANLSTVLGLYFLHVLKFSNNQTTIVINVKKIIGGIFALVGSAVADGHIGKFRTILYGTIIYGVGKILLAGASFYPSDWFLHPWFDGIVIVIILLGNGFIVPCVASFGGDQFEPHQERMISMFFSIFYASINAGALISTFLLPILRSKPCLGQDSCYPLSFGVSAACMLFASVIFFAGSGWYKKNPPKGNVYADVCSTVTMALKNKMQSKKERTHWLDHFLDTHDCKQSEKCLRLKRRKMDDTTCERESFLKDIRSLIRLLVMFAPLPMFWALYDQQYSVWLIQAIQMDIRLWDNVLLLPDMMQFVNPLLTLTFIFVFECLVYPLVSCFVKLTPLRKMVSGGVLAAVAFFVSAGVQLKVNATLPILPESGEAFVSFMNTFDHCELNITHLGDSDQSSDSAWRLLRANQSLENDRLFDRRELFTIPSGDHSWSIAYDGMDCADPESMGLPTKIHFRIDADKSINFVAIGRTGAFMAKIDPAKPTGGMGEFSLSLNLALSDTNYEGNLALCRANTTGTTPEHPCDPERAEDFYVIEYERGHNNKSELKGQIPYLHLSTVSDSHLLKVSRYPYRAIRPGNWNLYYLHNGHEYRTLDKDKLNVSGTGVNIQMQDQGGVYAVVLTGKMAKPKKRVFRVIPPNTVNILWQIPQIAIITAAEILFSIPGYEFAYSQSAASMKSMMQAFWFLTVAVGDLIIIGVTFFEFSDLAVQFVAYAVAMLVVIFIFALLAIFYYEYRVNSDHCSDVSDGEDEEYEGEMSKNDKNSNYPNYPNSSPHSPSLKMALKKRSTKTDE